MIKIYHNPRCTKSRQAIAVLEDAKVDFEVIKYLEDPLNKEELEGIISLLNITPIQLVRKTEAVWKELFKDKELSHLQVISAMVEYPKLIERPIIINGKNAIIGRPTAKISKILSFTAK
tara:strand:- start:3480 stop:3836 length:357 start_codon:yes stop_codon:yes gene_type:complete